MKGSIQMFDREPGWHDLYRAAILESDPEKVGLRIKEAHGAIRSRMAELRQQRSTESKERTLLDRSLYFLGMLHEISQTKKSPPTRVA
jgi:hypothetical protein